LEFGRWTINSNSVYYDACEYPDGYKNIEGLTAEIEDDDELLQSWVDYQVHIWTSIINDTYWVALIL